ncbi:biosynthetic-type acetolactate synthase large subunit [Caballeronia sp. GaOx3]|uniref:biosynthetic-type acetolactate synthase large subunit n=1 Tax=Caballeronia sp. GaOx3 TaxID=2921740 RepID=UPI0020295F71|nr:biosynthetic-type acetolactate synthase large subunit [Caballeronia sp. GaOx3]
MNHNSEELDIVESATSRDINLRGADMIVAALRAEGVRYVWGYPGGAALPIYDALLEQDHVKHILVRHEQGALHAADGFARSTGKVGVALVTSGPGVTNAITGIATAHFDSIPMVVIAASIPTSLVGEDAFQECDAIGITRPITKHNFMVRRVSELPNVLKKAFFLATSGRPGPVVVDVPKDILLDHGPFEYSHPIQIRSYRTPRGGHSGQIKQAAEALARAKRPYIYVGGGVVLAEAAEKLKEFVDLMGFPTTTTLMALGALSGADERCLGMPGMHGTYEANMAMHHCDVLLALGSRFDDRVIGNPDDFASENRTVIHVDIDPSSISKRVKVDVPIVGDLRIVIPQLTAELKRIAIRQDLTDWWTTICKWRARKCLAYDDGRETLRPRAVLERLRRITNDDAIVCSDVGQHQMWAAQYFKFPKPRRWINSGGLGTMGVGLPYAIGAKLGKPESDVIVVTGDGSIQMCIQELSTCLQYGINVKVLCFNNRSLGMVRQQQHVDHRGRYAHSYMDSLPDFVKLAEAYGHVGLRVETEDALNEALRTLVETKDRTVFLEVVIDPGERVWPMIRSGMGLTQMLLNESDIG